METEQPSHRLFLGIPLPETHLVPISQFRAQNQDLEGIRWIPYQNLHITTYFFGTVSSEMLPNLKELIRLGLQKASPFSLAFRDMYLAPKPQGPRMIWARYHKKNDFKEMVLILDTLYRQIHPDQQTRKSPIPHVTVARFKGFSDFGKLDMNASFAEKELEAKELILWESELNPEGPAYRVMERYGL